MFSCQSGSCSCISDLSSQVSSSFTGKLYFLSFVIVDKYYTLINI